MLRPASAVKLYLPKRSIIFTSDCLTTLIDAAATTKIKILNNKNYLAIVEKIENTKFI